MLKLWSIDEAQTYVAEARRSGRVVGIVPTMGALHDGHIALVRQSVQECDETIGTIFVNPTQFAPHEDLNRYPRTLDSDLELLAGAGATAVFIPSVEEMYPEGYSTYVEPPEVAKPLEGICRPGHYRGVTTVVLKLFNAIQAHRAYFGRKDYQQVKVVEAMVRDLNIRMQVVTCPTVRDPDGLAMSSRNRYLSAAERDRALLISRALSNVKQMAEAGVTSVPQLQESMRRTLLGEAVDGQAPASQGVDSIDYSVIVDADDLNPISTLERTAVALIAVRIGSTRLIDNDIIG